MRHRVQRPRRGRGGGGWINKIIDYDNHHLNQIPSPLPSSLHTPSPLLLIPPYPRVFCFLGRTLERATCRPPPPFQLHIFTHNKSLGSARRQKPTYVLIRVCICARVCVCPLEMLLTPFQDVELYTCSFFYQRIRARLHTSFFFFLRTFFL